MSNKNNSPEQKAAWKANQKLGSRFVKVIPSLTTLFRKNQKPWNGKSERRQVIKQRNSTTALSAN